ncbi:acyl carrier protein [Thiomonas sp.]|jgi:acyl carrier protein|uniref:acyl carrier protein n=1 Tax=Thiomonas sp. TaxID=2047785 RepID=UPI002633E40E|nr:acyl carrier protein [Thiomonas sp.]
MLEPFIRNHLIRHARVDASKFDNPDLLVAELALDSLGLVEMLFEIEERFGFQLSDPMRYQSMRFDQMVGAIEAELRAHNGGELPQADALRASAHS